MSAMPTTGNSNTIRLRQLAQNAGIDLLELQPKFSYRRNPPPIVTHDEVTFAEELLAQETLRTQKGKPLIRTKKKLEEHNFKIATSALSRLVQENGRAGVARYLLQIGSLGDDSNIRKEQTSLRHSLLKSAAEHENLGLVGLFASTASPEQLIDPLMVGLVRRNPKLIQILLENGGDPNHFPHAIRSAVAAGDTVVLELFLRAPNAISTDLVEEGVCKAVAAGNTTIVALLIQSATLSQLRRGPFLKTAIQRGRFDLFIVILYYTMEMPPDTLAGLLPLITQGVREESPMISAMLDALLVAGAVSIAEDAMKALSVCAERRMLNLVRLFLDHGVAPPLRAIRHAISTTDCELLNILLPDESWSPTTASQCVAALPNFINEEMRQYLLRRLLTVGAAGPFLDEELVRAVSLRQSNLVDCLLCRGASPSHNYGAALAAAVETEQVLVVKRLLATNVAPSILQNVFPLLQKASQLPRLLMSKLFVANGVNSQFRELLSVALHNAVCDKDEQLIHVLVDAGGSCDWKDGASLKVAIGQEDIHLFRRLVEGRNRSKGPRISTHIFSGLVMQAVNIIEQSVRDEFLKELINRGAEGHALASAFCQFLTSKDMDAELFDLFVLKSPLNVNFDNGEAVVKATLSNHQETLQKVMRVSDISPATISRAVACAVEHGFPDDAERASRVSLLLNGRNLKQVATQALKQTIDRCANDSVRGCEWPVPTLIALLGAGADVNVDSGSCIVSAASAGAEEVLRLLLSQNATVESLDFALQGAILLTDPEKQYNACGMILAAKPSQKTASQALVQATEQKSIQLCTMLLKSGARVDFAGGLCMSRAITDNSLELLKLFLVQDLIEQTVLERLWNELGPISSSEERTFTLCENLLQAGLAGPVVDSTLLKAVSDRDIALCALLLDHRMTSQETLPKVTEAVTTLARASSTPHRALAKDAGKQTTVLDEALLQAIETGQEDLCSLILAHGASAQYKIGMPIRAAITKGETSILKMLLDASSESEARLAVDNGLYFAVKLRLPNVCVFLLDRQKEYARFDDEEVMRVVTQTSDIALLQIFLDAKPSPATLTAAFKASQSLEDPARTGALRAILESGFRDECLNIYLFSIVSTEQPPTSLIRLLLEHGASPNHRDNRSILTAARNGHVEILGLLLEKSATDDLIGQCFLEAVKSEQLTDRTIETVQFLLHKGVAVASTTQALVAVVLKDQSEDRPTSLATLLIAHGADVNHCGGQALCYACSMGNPTLVRALLNAGPSVETKNCAFAYLFKSKVDDASLIECMESFMSGPGERPGSSQSSDFGRSILELLLFQRPDNPELLCKFLESGYPVSTTSKSQSIVHWALEQKTPLQETPLISGACLEVLIKHVGDMDRVDSIAGQPSLLLAVENQRHDVIPSLVKHGAKVDFVTPTGKSLMMLASEAGFVEVVKTLIKEGAAINDGSLHEAARELSTDVARVLIRAGHNVNHQSPVHGGRSALAELCLKASTVSLPRDSRRPRDLIRLLMKEGADPMVEVDGKTIIFLALDGESPILIVDALLGMFREQKNDMNGAFHTRDGFCYSPTTYVTGGLCLGPRRERANMLKLLKRYGVRDVFYALEGPQPDTAVGVPPYIAKIEAERKLREERLTRGCEVCGERPANIDEIFGALTSDCNHEWKHVICKDCLQQYLASKTLVESGFVSDKITCWAPDCKAVLEHHEVQKYASREDFDRYEQDLVRQLIHAGQTYVECSYTACKGGGWCEPETVSWFVCEICKKSTCVACNTPKHKKGKVCPNSEEGKRLKEEAKDAKKRGEQDKASEAEVARISKRCPNANCGANIQKNEGCDHMTCTRCRSEFCYLCIAPYGDIRKYGNSRHLRTCNYYA